MEILRWKARLSVLWVFNAVGMSAGLFLSFMMPGVIEEVMAGEIEGMPLSEGTMVMFMLFWLIPLVMAVLCFTLKDSPNRWLNFVLGILFAIFFIIEIISYAVEVQKMLSIALWVIYIAALVVNAFIAWFAWKWPKQEA